MEMMDIVDPQDCVVGTASKQQVYEQRLPHRIVHVFIFDDALRMAVQKRSADCSYCPLHWSMAAAGHVSAGETYEQAAARELKEELGIELPLQFVDKTLFLDPNCAETFIGVFRATSNGPFTLEPTEVQEIHFYTRAQIDEMIKAGEPFHPQLIHVLQNEIFATK